MRRGMTLIELAVTLTISGLIFGEAFDVLNRLQRMAAADHTSGARAEEACLLLRRDLAAGAARVTGDELRIPTARGEVVWSLADNQLQRDGRLILAAVRCTVAERDRLLVLTLTPTGLPARRIEVRR